VNYDHPQSKKGKKMKQASDEPQKRHDNDGLHRRRGTWYYCLNIAGERRFFSTKCTNYQEARKVRAKAIQDQEAGRLPNDLSKWPFEKLLAQVIENRKVDLSENSRRIDKERSGPLLKHFTGRRVSTIDAAAIRAYQAERSRKVGNRTINLETKLLRNVLKTAKTWATVADDYKPFEGRPARSGARDRGAPRKTSFRHRAIKARMGRRVLLCTGRGQYDHARVRTQKPAHRQHRPAKQRSIDPTIERRHGRR
jgi:hypothetical protein